MPKIRKDSVFILGIIIGITVLEYIFAYLNVGYGIIPITLPARGYSITP